jgi:hypothetical protein
MNCLIDQFYFAVDEFFQNVAIDEKGKEKYSGISDQQGNPEDSFIQDKRRADVKERKNNNYSCRVDQHPGIRTDISVKLHIYTLRLLLF